MQGTWGSVLFSALNVLAGNPVRPLFTKGSRCADRSDLDVDEVARSMLIAGTHH